MSPISRRTLLGSAVATGAALGAGALPAGLQQALAAPAQQGTLDDVEHVVVLMQENRSFDHYFGTLNGARGYGDSSLLRFPNGSDVLHQRLLGSVGGTTLLPWHLDTATSDAQRIFDLDHSWDGTHSAWANGQYNNWVPAKSWYTMGYYRRQDIPFQYALADAFTLCDQYFCSTMASTNPNRLYLWSGMVDPHGTGGGPVVDNSEKGYAWTTYPERLQAAGVSWKVYQQEDNYDDNALAWFKQYQNASKDSPLHVNGMVKRGPDDFAQDVAAGNLPAVSWVVAPTDQSEHPNHPPAQGADFTSSYVLEALAAHPEVWAKTVVLLNYDENDGFFDHVIPPAAPDGTPDEFINGAPIGLGPRVPMIVISPWSRGGRINSEVFDHTSVLRFLENWTGVREPNISAWRRTVCGDLMSAFDFRTPATTFPPLPDTKKLLADLAEQHKKVLPPLFPPLVQHFPEVEPGDRPSLPTGYRFGSSSRTDTAKGLLWITIDNLGTLGAGLSMYTVNHRRFGAWRYTLPVGGSVTDYFSAQSVSGGPYDIDTHGPDGFLRGYQGDVRTWTNPAKAHPEIAAVEEPNGIRLTLTNTGGKAATFTLPTQQITVAPGGSEAAVVPATNAGRYDFTVTADTGDGFARRFAGRLQP
ncbi:phospholipase C, phosphocholine-specific [Streptomyces sp. H10-C2]|uniref:phosphocholine-specific phospholipase C n=1 Tax=unclassified Streptomyces TaxID=2593676 RepID=UPI0024BAD57B|nr:MULTISPECIES: phospholipase C, phosphocholine-specific [unclassified Streptomyces]MDJ0343677.1 phospholipase C, phosphocholine-specific [Streptomyces sp. PH10-H1]MDJ0372396.1 phospholipase C, phosphocholine-specific [Streptomyces sp. H10-C2]